MKLCKVCNQEKQYNLLGATAKDKGFVGKICWACYTRARRLGYYGIDALKPKPEDLALEAALQASKLERRKLRSELEAARAERTTRKLSPEYLAKERAKIEAEEEKREQKYKAWTEKQRLKNVKILAAHDALQKRYARMAASLRADIEAHRTTPRDA